jgi:hypothetical protein
MDDVRVCVRVRKTSCRDGRGVLWVREGEGSTRTLSRRFFSEVSADGDDGASSDDVGDEDDTDGRDGNI